MTDFKQSRLGWVDIAKGILIALVVFGHIEPVGVEYANDFGHEAIRYSRLWIVSFHMPAFFIISGMLKGMKDTNSSMGLMSVMKKQKKIWIYYLIFSVLFFLQWIVKVKTGQYEADKLYEFAINTITLTGVGVLWFIPAFALSLLFFEIVTKGTKIWKVIYGLALTSILIITMVCDIPDPTVTNSILLKVASVVGRALVGASFMLIGFGIQKSGIIQSKWIYTCIPISLLCFTNSIVDMHYLKFNNVLLYYLFSIAGSLSVFVLSKGLSKSCNALKTILLKWGGILCLSCALICLCLSKQGR